jgi:hypothetical protein
MLGEEGGVFEQQRFTNGKLRKSQLVTAGHRKSSTQTVRPKRAKTLPKLAIANKAMSPA